MNNGKPRTLELLAPARDAATGIAAILAGADAVYIGGPDHGARASAGNSVEDIKRLCETAHRFRARVYVTLNTLIYDDEIAAVERLVSELYAAGVDALIVQDMALLRMNIPPIALHASTQCDTRTAAKAAFLEACGMSQIVLPRELSLDEIREFARSTSVPLEAFVHGALCVCYSGDCRASLVMGGRSANRGECAQICRLPYDLVAADGNVLISGRHLLSLRDLNRLDSLRAMADAGVSSFKIEGRLKSRSYVVNVVRAYSLGLDAVCKESDGLYRRMSAGEVEYELTPDVSRVFNRGFTSYFLRDTRPGKDSLLSARTPKFVGEKIGAASSCVGNVLTIKGCNKYLHNGDGIAWFNDEGRFEGIRVNRVDGRRLFLTRQVSIAPGTQLYRNFDKEFEDKLDSTKLRRLLPVSVNLRKAPGTIVADITDTQRKLYISASVDFCPEKAHNEQLSTQREIFNRLGDTIYRLDEFTSELSGCFVPRSTLSELRRRAFETLDLAAAATRPIELRRRENKEVTLPEKKLTFHDNIANNIAAAFYREHGAESTPPAMEINIPKAGDEIRVMTTRYCLRRELGACLREKNAAALPSPLYLRPSADNRTKTSGRLLRLDFDCAACRMHVTACPSKFRK